VGGVGLVGGGVAGGGAGRLWAAGGGTGEIRAYDAASGELLETYPVEAGFLNDVVATDEAVYVTDSFMPQVLVIPLGDGGSLSAPEEAASLPIGGELEYGEGFNVNGIVAAPAGLIVVHSAEGQLYRVDPATGEAALIDIGDASVSNGDGLELDGQRLYVVRNQLNQIVALDLDEGATAATLAGEDLG
jgi:sugar lactone lactonase YvrE